jgi:hypothetical protein
MNKGEYMTKKLIGATPPPNVHTLTGGICGLWFRASSNIQIK